MAREAAREIGNVASDLINAPRRLGFRRRANAHPVDGVDDPKLAIATISLAFLELGGLPAREDQYALAKTLSQQLALPRDDADEMLILGRWLIGECQGPQPAITRLTKRLGKLDAGAFQQLLPILNTVGSRTGGLNDRQRDALEEIARILKLR
ncbi:hypothetical protein [Paracoccus sp. S1E-3]|uniref:hypothetical protein n=1 Tax=Paracoccus sp. S1E-3 TaxID=2756130 RepID=UPI0015EF47EC|nr:hypothetical protein [Paracoccus sp. S1E-3]MBA4491416.1 hypothetical protein [Paracoccus sp. S1E-3]